MSQVNFDNLISDHPEHERALRLIQSWLNRHHRTTSIYLDDLIVEVPVDSAELADTLSLLVQEHVLRRFYKVLTPDGVYADRKFNSPTEIPEKLADRFEHYFDTDESDIVPVFEMVA